MRQINFDNVVAKQEGAFSDLPAGAYVCAITAMEDVPSAQYVRMEVDVLQGEHANFFSGKHYRDKPWSHSMVLSYKDTALGMLKGRLEVIAACNAGFDAEAAWNGNIQLFVGKTVCVVFRAEEYLSKKTAEFRIGSPRPDRLCRMEDMADPRNADPLPKMMTDEQKAKALKRAGISADPEPETYDGDVPF